MVDELFKIQIKLTFRYGHRLFFPYIGKCANVHGEFGTAIVEIGNKQLDDKGMVVDFGDLKRKIKVWVDENWDHSYLHHPSDEVGVYIKGKGLRTFDMGVNPTAENMAKYLYYQVDKIVSQYPNCFTCKVGIVESSEDNIAWYEIVRGKEGGKKEKK